MTQQTFRLPATATCPSLFVRRQPVIGAPAVLYVHGATFPSALSVGFDFGGGRWPASWLDDWNARGFDAWAFDFAGFGESGRYAEMSEPADRHAPLGRAAHAATQVAAVLALIRRETGGQPVSLVAHSWGSMPAALAAIAEPDAVDRLILFGPIARRVGGASITLPAWSDVGTDAQYARFVEDVPKDHPPVLVAFDRWAPAYLASDPGAATRTPPAVRIPNGPRADIAEAWAGRLAWDPARLTRPVTIVRGAWDSLCRGTDAAMILDAAQAAPSRVDLELEAGTHLMHLETGRRRLYDAVGRSLKGEIR
ncbi:Lysophospholipase, alpha-beta hydrolase superfamily [Enhydrobacter aerosaccus]|uniref:Lysophospholipase, alpha-beta hydrolase superfamily n=1 Tax=Enhydrobacter aerosaccus TaxID=225324 RepID=A0A1T4NBD1_9HYPH|nr:alpha/beta fold hydrolase [Enhydrobacter aerosaccus]SJZ76561.1 Lysophospholipase, alpha-beta hydrolase superfamily [Enhydrobacter aerosaccus]